MLNPILGNVYWEVTSSIFLEGDASEITLKNSFSQTMSIGDVINHILTTRGDYLQTASIEKVEKRVAVF